MSRRIDTVVRVRELQERLARADVARRQADAATAAHREATAWGLLADRDRALRGELAGTRFGARELALAGGLQAGLGAERRHAEVRRAVGQAIDRWMLAARDHDGVERLAARLADEARAEAERQAAITLDELVVLRHGRSA